MKENLKPCVYKLWNHIQVEPRTFCRTVRRVADAGKVKDLSLIHILILLDVMMPRMDGWEVLKTIRQYSQVPIIMLTARAEARDELQGFDLGAVSYTHLLRQQQNDTDVSPGAPG